VLAHDLLPRSWDCQGKPLSGIEGARAIAALRMLDVGCGLGDNAE